MNRRNIVITGIGRSGTTLTCRLLNKLPNTIALSEPMPPRKFEDYMPDLEAVCDLVERYFRRMSRNTLRKSFVISKPVGGIVPDNTKGTVDVVLQRIAERVGSAAWTPSRYETTWFVYRPTPALVKRFLDLYNQHKPHGALRCLSPSDSIFIEARIRTKTLIVRGTANEARS